jgi:hypothetical protein
MATGTQNPSNSRFHNNQPCFNSNHPTLSSWCATSLVGQLNENPRRLLGEDAWQRDARPIMKVNFAALVFLTSLADLLLISPAFAAGWYLMTPPTSGELDTSCAADRTLPAIQDLLGALLIFAVLSGTKPEPRIQPD